MCYVYSCQKVDACGTLILFSFGQMPSLDGNKMTEKNLTMSVPVFMHCNAHAHTMSRTLHVAGQYCQKCISDENVHISVD